MHDAPIARGAAGFAGDPGDRESEIAPVGVRHEQDVAVARGPVGTPAARRLLFIQSDTGAPRLDMCNPNLERVLAGNRSGVDRLVPASCAAERGREEKAG